MEKTQKRTKGHGGRKPTQLESLQVHKVFVELQMYLLRAVYSGTMPKWLKNSVGLSLSNTMNFCVECLSVIACSYNTQEKIEHLRLFVREWLKESLNITLHPRKCYIQHYTKGVSFVGGIIKPHRRYLSHRCRRKALAKIHWISKGNLTLEKARESANSYLGITQHFTAYKLRKEIAGSLFTRFGNNISFGTNYSKMIIN